MNAKHLFLTLVTIVACSTMASATTVTDEISLTTLAGKGLMDEDDNSMSNWTFNSTATYSCGNFYYSTSEDVIGLYDQGNEGKAFATTASAGNVKSITIDWLDDDSYNKSGTTPAVLNVYARNSTPYTGNETTGTINGSEYVGSITYGSSVKYTFSEDYEYIALLSPTASTSGAWVQGISIEWEEATYYSVSVGTIQEINEGIITDIDAFGTVVSVDKTANISEGEIVTITFAPRQTGKGKNKVNYSLTSYGFDDMVFDLSCGEYIKTPNTYTVSFPMPARNVNIDATFEKIEYVTTKVLIDKSVTTVQSGLEVVIPFEHVIDDGSSNPVPEYTADLMTATSDAPANLYVDAPVKVSDGHYTITVHGLLSGSATVNIVAAAKGTYNSSNASITLTVIPRQVALVAEVDGRYYVAKNTLTSSKLEAIEVYKHGDKYLYPEGFNAADVTWYISTLNSDGSEYSVQNEYDQFLAPTGLNFKFQAGSFTWYDAEGRYQDITTEKYIAYNTSSTKFTMGSYEAAAKDVQLSAFYPMTYSTSSTADVGIVDARNIKSTYGTICVPFDVASSSVTSSGATFYTIDSKIVSGSSLGGIMLSEPHTALVAGHSYIYEMKEGVHVINFTGSGSYLYNAEDIADDGLVGSLAKDGEAEDGVVVVPGKVEPKSDGNYVLSSDQLRYVKISPEATVQQTIKAFRAYIAASEISAGAPAPGRKMIVSDEAESIVTAIVDIPDAMFINWSEPVYNIMGMRVGKGATGVLIQNGQKFFVQ